MSVSLWLSDRLCEGQAEPCLWYHQSAFSEVVLFTLVLALNQAQLSLGDPTKGRLSPTTPLIYLIFVLIINLHLSADDAVP